MKCVDVTNKVDFQFNDDEALPITKCVCGKIFRPWEFTISIYDEDARECPECGAKLFFGLNIVVYKIDEKG